MQRVPGEGEPMIALHDAIRDGVGNSGVLDVFMLPPCLIELFEGDYRPHEDEG